jgi:hypothetical protein
MKLYLSKNFSDGQLESELKEEGTTFIIVEDNAKQWDMQR